MIFHGELLVITRWVHSSEAMDQMRSHKWWTRLAWRPVWALRLFDSEWRLDSARIIHESMFRHVSTLLVWAKQWRKTIIWLTESYNRSGHPVKCTCGLSLWCIGMNSCLQNARRNHMSHYKYHFCRWDQLAANLLSPCDIFWSKGNAFLNTFSSSTQLTRVL